MPLNISGSLVSSNTAEALEHNSIVQRDLTLHLDPDSTDYYPGKDVIYDQSGVSNTSGDIYTGTALTFDGSDDWIEHTQITHP